MSKPRFLGVLILFGVGIAASGRAQSPDVPQEIHNWRAPATWSPEAQSASFSEEDSYSKAGVPTPPFPFVGITPCRVADTRDASFPPGYGPPSLPASTPRNFTMTGRCGIPGSAEAVSLNITVTNTQGPGFILINPQGATPSLVSTLNYVAGQTVANAAVVPLGTGGGISVTAGVSGTDLIIDTNGYYGGTLVNSINGLSGNLTLAPGSNVGITPSAGTLTISATGGPGGDLPAGSSGQTLRRSGSAWVANSALTSDGTDVGLTGALNLPAAVRVNAGGDRFLHNFGNFNTFLGSVAGNLSMTGIQNTASGYSSLTSNTTGNNNTATGVAALFSNTTGIQNTATGLNALATNDSGNNNTATGFGALAGNLTGDNNTAIGFDALASNDGGFQNTAIGQGALLNNTTGLVNIAIGALAGSNLTTGVNNICIDHTGVAGESATIRIGREGVQIRAFIAGIRNRTTGVADAIPVLIDSQGQLGTTSSSARFKDAIEEMGDASSGLLDLRPVTFRYKGQTEGANLLHFGLITEEVDEVLPELVVHRPEGQAETVLYHEMPAMLLNELQKQQKRIEALEARLAELEGGNRSTGASNEQ